MHNPLHDITVNVHKVKTVFRYLPEFIGAKVMDNGF